MKSLTSILRACGASPGDIRLLDDSETVGQSRYLNWRLREGKGSAPKAMAVVEVQGRPLVYAVEQSIQSPTIPSLRRSLTFRGDADYLAVVEPGRISVFELDLAQDNAPVLNVELDSSLGQVLIPTLANSPPGPSKGASRVVHDFLFSLLDSTTDSLMGSGLTSDIALSLMGRALFLRFLVDRQVLLPSDARSVCPTSDRIEDCFADARNAASTCRWLDQTFNGDLLPLPEQGTLAWFERQKSPEEIFKNLSMIMSRTEPSGQMQFQWAGVEFDQVPVGLLSEVYEAHFHKFHREQARATSVHYTPHAIAEYMVDEAFAGLAEPHNAKVLDPAAGAGVFLVAALRRLVEEDWRHSGTRPNTSRIRKLMRQISGFEINEAALRLSALSLYLSALELDPNPRPLSKLGFANLRGTILFDVGTVVGGDDHGALQVAGSLGPLVSRSHAGAYDVVVGNPPWTAWKRASSKPLLLSESLSSVRPLVEKRLGLERANKFKVPDLVPDILFIWRCMEWARPDGIIALAMHARLLFKQSDVGRQTRTDLFEAIEITGILNGTALRSQDVWPKVSAPFCLVFARNRKPASNSQFIFASPELDRSVNRRGRIRIDSSSADAIDTSMLKYRPYLLKTLFRGMPLDVSVVEKITDSAANRPLGTYWSNTLGLHYGQGYQVGGKSRGNQSALRLKGLYDLAVRPKGRFFVDPLELELPRFSQDRLLYPRSIHIYQAPLVIIDEAPSPNRFDGLARLSWSPMAFNRSFIGFSTHGHRRPKTLARYLFLIINSCVFLYDALMRSSKFGVERELINVEDLERFPVRPLRDLPADSVADIRSLSNALMAGEISALADIDRWVCGIYGLNKWDLEVINDTLSVSLPYTEAQRRGQAEPTDEVIHRFADRLALELSSFGYSVSGQVSVRVINSFSTGPWRYLVVGRGNLVGKDADRPYHLLAEHADDVGASQIIAETSDHTILVGILSQYRYWTQSRARLLAADLLRNYSARLFSDKS